MSERATAIRKFANISLAGAVITGVLWMAVVWAVQAAFDASRDSQTVTQIVQGSGSETPENRQPAMTAFSNWLQNTRARASRAAGLMIVAGGALTTLIVAIRGALQAARETREKSLLVEKLQWMASAEPTESLLVPQVETEEMQFIFRRLADAYENHRRRYMRLESERRLGFHVLGHMTDGVLAVASDRRVMLLNSAARRLLGMNREKPSGRKLADVIRTPQILSVCDAVLAGKGPQQLEFDASADTDRSLRVLAIELPAENNAGVLVTVRDETQIRQLERLRREFIANVSHELKTPLAAVKGYAETLQLGAKEEEETCTYFLDQILFQATRLERLINDMLQLARAQAGTTNLTLSRIPLAGVIRESLATYESVATARDIELRWDPIPENAAVIADREALLTIVNNLLGNAVRYTPEGGKVHLHVAAMDSRWRIVVKDTGIGIPKEDQERIFERFYRVEKARDATRGGTGLGLSIVKNLVQSLGGEVRLESELNKGSTFEVWLQAAGAKEEAPLRFDPPR